MLTAKNTSLRDLRKNLVSLVDEAYYYNKQFRLTRHKKPLARLVGEHFMKNLEKLINQDAGVRETLEIMIDANLANDLRISQKEVEQGKLIPLSDLVKE